MYIYIYYLSIYYLYIIHIHTAELICKQITHQGQ